MSAEEGELSLVYCSRNDPLFIVSFNANYLFPQIIFVAVAKAFVQHYYNTFDSTAVDNLAGLFVSRPMICSSCLPTWYRRKHYPTPLLY
jgi:hypothetical protein